MKNSDKETQKIEEDFLCDGGVGFIGGGDADRRSLVAQTERAQITIGNLESEAERLQNIIRTIGKKNEKPNS